MSVSLQCLIADVSEKYQNPYQFRAVKWQRHTRQKMYKNSALPPSDYFPSTHISFSLRSCLSSTLLPISLPSPLHSKHHHTSSTNPHPLCYIAHSHYPTNSAHALTDDCSASLTPSISVSTPYLLKVPLPSPPLTPTYTQQKSWILESNWPHWSACTTKTSNSSFAPSSAISSQHRTSPTPSSATRNPSTSTTLPPPRPSTSSRTSCAKPSCPSMQTPTLPPPPRRNSHPSPSNMPAKPSVGVPTQLRLRGMSTKLLLSLVGK